MSNESIKKRFCPACGEEIRIGSEVRVEGYYLCQKCYDKGNCRTALKIAKSKHREKLEKIWAELKKIEYE